MKKKIIIFIVCTVFSAAGFAQKDAKAKEVLDKASATFSNAGGLSANFTLNIKDAGSKTNQSFEGEIFLKKDKFFITVPEQDIYFDGKTQWVYYKSYQEVNISEPNKQEVQAMNPASIFQIYTKDCDYKYTGEKTDTKMRKVKEVTLLPKGKNKDISRIDMQINTADFLPVYFHIYYRNQLENIIYIHKYKPNQRIPDSRFVFDVKEHPGTDIIDLR
ncbi:MAG: outer membrane lipoprotein carrier protein LolA [Dysgonamonadaceae bacterium]|jgi:outer membrane lipoprotein-sorting protein|nr:outer membrane lipoprotein carrier protein LolA [Dysgonamonadaceae bacterium]